MIESVERQLKDLKKNYMELVKHEKFFSKPKATRVRYEEEILKMEKKMEQINNILKEEV